MEESLVNLKSVKEELEEEAMQGDMLKVRRLY